LKSARLLWELDPEWGHAPWRATPQRPERVLHVHLATGEEPQASLCDALASLAEPGGHERIDWTALATPAERHRAVVDAAGRLRPTLIFMQLQRPGVLSPQTIQDARRASGRDDCVIATWCGDVGGVNGPDSTPGDAYAFDLGRHCDLMLYTSSSQVRAHRSRGMACAAYLQIGYDEARYFEGDESQYGTRHDVVFLGSKYQASHFAGMKSAETGLRSEVVGMLRQRFGDRFGLFGNGWGDGVASLPPAQSGEAYRHSHLGISVSLTSQLERYSSDRLFRALACGAPVLVKDFSDAASLGLRDGVNCLVWTHPQEAVDSVERWVAPERRQALRVIGRRGAALACEHHAWTTRLLELSPLLAAARGQSPKVTRPW